MSQSPRITGRVNAIKSQFENLNSLESLDISGVNVKKNPQTTSTYQFQRAATCFDLKNSEKAKSIVRKWGTSELPKQSSDSAVLAKKQKDSNKHLQLLRPTQNKIRPLQEQQANVEVKLSRHTSDPVKRSSIKRSPAFRVGEKANKAVLVKHTINIAGKELNEEKLEDLLTGRVTDKRRLHQPGLTDSLRHALKKPLPSGPPPKKPPRTFSGGSPTEDITTAQLFEEKDMQSKRKTEESSTINTDAATTTIKNKINFLESNLLLNNGTQLSKNRNNNKKWQLLQKSKTEMSIMHHGTKLLNLISCHKDNTVIYDSVTPDDDLSFTEQQQHVEHSMSQPNFSDLANRFPKSKNPSEHIYMVPFSHLGVDGIIGTAAGDNKRKSSYPSISEDGETCMENTTSVTSVNQQRKMSFCNCPENHSKDDLHYLCTAIDSNLSSENENGIENNRNLTTLKKTYDEIKILVNAAFQQHKSSSSDSEESDINNTSIMGNNLSDNDNKTKLHRSLTEKRKDYIKRVAVVTSSPFSSPEKNHQNTSNSSSSYGTLHKTFKSPIFKTFSVDERKYRHETEAMNINSNLSKENSDNDSNDDDIVLSKETISDRIKKYKKLVEDNTNSKSKSTATNTTNKLLKTQKNVQQNAKNCSIKLRTKKQMHEEQGNDSMEDMVPEINTSVENSMAEVNGNSLNEKLFQVCILVGYNTSSNSGYIKWKYPLNEPIPDNIEQLIFPSRDILRSDRTMQDYCLILTDDNGFKVYGYCRRVLPENTEICLPLCYCIITVTKALGFYQKLLKEIECRHGQTDLQIKFLLKNLQNSRIPVAGKYLHVKLPLSIRPKTFFSSQHKISPKRLSLEANPKWLTEAATQAAFSTMAQDLDNDSLQSTVNNSSTKKSYGLKSLVEEFEEKKNSPPLLSQQPFDFGLINRSLMVRDPKFDEILIRRPNDLRLENTELSELLNCFGPELLISVFSTLLLERKVILQSRNISLLTKSILALQTILYPFQWQYTIVTILPSTLIDICQAPFPVLAGVLETVPFEIEDGIAVDLDRKILTQSCGDEQTILPDSLAESLQLSLEMVDLIDQGKMLSSVLISEAFLRFFVILFGDYRQKYFHKEEFIQMQQSQKIKFFLEWFVETSMFRHFCHTRYSDNRNQRNDCDNFYYDLFEARLLEKSENKTTENLEKIVKNSKIINKKGKTFKERFKVFLNNN